MAEEVRVTTSILKVLKALLENPRQERSGADISRATGLGSGTLYPALSRLEGAGWLSSKWENIEPKKAGRPRKRFYRLTGEGQTRASRALAEVQTAPGVLQWN